MGLRTYSDCLSEVAKIKSVKTNIKDAIVAKGVSIPSSTPFSEYASLISGIETRKPEEAFTVTPTNSDISITPQEGYAFSGGTILGYDVDPIHSAIENLNIGSVEKDNRFNELVEGTISGDVSGDMSKIGSFAFAYTSITGANFPNVTEVGFMAFSYCRSLTTVSFPECKYVGSSAFIDCWSLTSAYLSKVESIADHTFIGCTNLTSVYAPKCTMIDLNAFSYCSKFLTPSLDNTLYSPDYSWALSWRITRPDSVTFPSGCYLIANYLFSSYAGVIYPTYAEGRDIKYIGSSAFYYCTNLSSVYFPECVSVGSQAFKYCSSLTTMSLPKCEYLGTGALAYCINISSVYFPECTFVGNYAFSRCSTIQEINLPKCSKLGSNVFTLCTNLTSVSLPECTEVGQWVFDDCSSLTTLSLPKLVKANLSAFASCTSLESVYFMGSSIVNISPHNGTQTFDGTPMVKSSYLGHFGSIYVPSSLVTQYKTNTYWKTISDRFVGI